MHDTYVTVIGNVVSDPALRSTGAGVPVVNLRVASTPRHYDNASREWRDRETTFLSVSCWRSLAEHVGRSVRRGDPVIVHGRLVQRTYETGQGERRTSTEVEATALGHDLTRGAAAFARQQRAGRPAVEAVTGPAGGPVNGPASDRVTGAGGPGSGGAGDAGDDPWSSGAPDDGGPGDRLPAALGS